MIKLAFSFAAAALVATASTTPSYADSDTFNTARMSALISVKSPEIAPDGKRAVVIAQHVNLKEDKYENDLDIFDLATHARRTLTYKRTGLSDPAWSPDGTRIAFIANQGEGEEAKPQVFVMPLDGGDARPVTSDEGGVEQFAWRPDGEAIAYAADQPKPKKSGASKYRDAFVFTTEPITTREPDQPVHLFVVGADGGLARQLTRGPQSVATGEAATSISWSADGKTIAFSLAPNAILNDATVAHIELVDVSSAKIIRLTTFPNFESAPVFSPDGKHVAYQHSDGDSQVNRNDAYVTVPGEGNGVDVTADYDRQVHESFWSADSSTLYFTCANGTALQLVRTGLDKKPTAVDLGDLNATIISHGTSKDGSIAFVGTTGGAPGELYLLSAKGGAPERISNYNASTRSLTLAKAETISYASSLGMTADGVLWYPPGYPAGRTYPLVLLIHGGPTGSSSTAFDSWAQTLAGRGWLVLEPNYRGSDNLGLKYMRGVLYDPDEGPGKDIMAAVSAVESKGIVDTHRIAVSGWSYGGIMTAWMISKYHIWRAAVSGASVNDWATDYGVADDSESDAALFHGSPYVRNNYTSEWKRASAITYAADVTTPVLIVSDAGDNRDPFATSSMYYRALRDNHKNATLVQYPVDGHFPHDPIRRADVFDRFSDFISAHFR